MTLYTQAAANVRRTWIYLSLYLLIFWGLAAAAAAYFGDTSILFIGGVIALVQGLISIFASDSLALAVSRAKPLDEVAPAPVAARVKRLTEELCITAGLQMPRLYVIPDSAMNAFAAGRNEKKAVVALTAGLIDNLDDNELRGVIAHELAHIGNKDILLMGMVAVMAGAIALIADMFLHSTLFGRRREGEGGGALLLVALAFAILAPLVAALIQLAISRRREFLADGTAVLITRYPEGLISALRKISGDQEPLEVANRGNAHMYFSNPLKGGVGKLFSTHPPVEDRIAALQKGSGIL